METPKNHNLQIILIVLSSAIIVGLNFYVSLN
jgi:hypothetical protein